MRGGWNKMLRKIWRIVFPPLVWLVVIYLLVEIFGVVISYTAAHDMLAFAKKDPSEFIWWFLMTYIGFIVTSVGILYGAHRLLHLRGNYELPLGVLSLITVFTTLTTLMIQFTGSNIPKTFLVLTLVNILLSVALTTTSKLLKWQRRREIRIKKQK